MSKYPWRIAHSTSAGGKQSTDRLAVALTLSLKLLVDG